MSRFFQEGWPERNDELPAGVTESSAAKFVRLSRQRASLAKADIWQSNTAKKRNSAGAKQSKPKTTTLPTPSYPRPYDVVSAESRRLLSLLYLFTVSFMVVLLQLTLIAHLSATWLTFTLCCYAFLRLLVIARFLYLLFRGLWHLCLTAWVGLLRPALRPVLFVITKVLTSLGVVVCFLANLVERVLLIFDRFAEERAAEAKARQPEHKRERLDSKYTRTRTIHWDPDCVKIISPLAKKPARVVERMRPSNEAIPWWERLSAWWLHFKKTKTYIEYKGAWDDGARFADWLFGDDEG